jgi:DNA-binding MarR family transcriptional regulator
VPASKSPSPDPSVVAGDVAARLRAAVARIDRLSSREVLGSALTRTQFSVLGALARRGEQRLSDLVEREGLNPTMLSRVVGARERNGWAVRSQHPDDGRAVLVEVTPAGRELYQRLQRERSALIEEHLRGLTGEQARTLVAALPLLEGLADHMADHLAEHLRSSRAGAGTAAEAAAVVGR